VRAASGVRSFRRGSQDRAHDEAGPEVLKPSAWSLAWTSSTGAGAWRARQAGCGRRPVADHVVTAGVVPGALRHCLRGAGLRSGGWPGARYPGQLVLAGSPGRSVSRSPCRCWGMPGSARRRTGPCCGACPSSRIPVAGRAVCGVRPGAVRRLGPVLRAERSRGSEQAGDGDPSAGVITETGCPGSCRGYMEWAS